MKPRDIFLAKLRRGEAPRPGVGSVTSIVTVDLMDKLDVHFPDAHLDPEKMAALAAAGYTEIGFDNVMPLFSVMHESAAIGCEIDWGAPNIMPTCPKHACSDIQEEVVIPRDFLKHPACATPLSALRLLTQRLGREVAVVGKVFGPWTLGYHVFGVENFLIATLTDPDAVKRAMRTLIEVTVAFGKAQVEAGADALCLGDHCTRDLCSPAAYEDFLMEIHRELNERIACPLVLHICGDTSDRIGFIRSMGIDCFHFDSKVPAVRARELAGSRLALMGGTSNLDIVLGGTPETIERDVADKVEQSIDVIGPECAVPLNAPVANLKRIVEEVKRRFG